MSGDGVAVSSGTSFLVELTNPEAPGWLDFLELPKTLEIRAVVDGREGLVEYKLWGFKSLDFAPGQTRQFQSPGIASGGLLKGFNVRNFGSDAVDVRFRTVGGGFDL
jgi:hypothetical protein